MIQLTPGQLISPFIRERTCFLSCTTHPCPGWKLHILLLLFYPPWRLFLSTRGWTFPKHPAWKKNQLRTTEIKIGVKIIPLMAFIPWPLVVRYSDTTAFTISQYLYIFHGYCSPAWWKLIHLFLVPNVNCVSSTYLLKMKSNSFKKFMLGRRKGLKTSSMMEWQPWKRTFNRRESKNNKNSDSIKWTFAIRWDYCGYRSFVCHEDFCKQFFPEYFTLHIQLNPFASKLFPPPSYRNSFIGHILVYVWNSWLKLTGSSGPKMDGRLLYCN